MRIEENNCETEQDRNTSAPSKRILTHYEGSKLYQEYEEKRKDMHAYEMPTYRISV